MFSSGRVLVAYIQKVHQEKAFCRILASEQKQEEEMTEKKEGGIIILK